MSHKTIKISTIKTENQYKIDKLTPYAIEVRYTSISYMEKNQYPKDPWMDWFHIKDFGLPLQESKKETNFLRRIHMQNTSYQPNYRIMHTKTNKQNGNCARFGLQCQLINIRKDKICLNLTASLSGCIV